MLSAWTLLARTDAGRPRGRASSSINYIRPEMLPSKQRQCVNLVFIYI